MQQLEAAACCWPEQCCRGCCCWLGPTVFGVHASTTAAFAAWPVALCRSLYLELPRPNDLRAAIDALKAGSSPSGGHAGQLQWGEAELLQEGAPPLPSYAAADPSDGKARPAASKARLDKVKWPLPQDP